ncbi:hypothetical protein [Bacillus sp. MUM 13]|uniref:hypothetical protein n=1 Tax=Bacillus sp. MUM 13 TaxID=1678001 RepID=UPI001113F110|nr:hypothetical protein [Bacillus sp. MUM 13]
MEKEWRLFRSVYFRFQLVLISTVVLAFYSYFIYSELPYVRISTFFLKNKLSYLMMLFLIVSLLYYTFLGVIKGKRINRESKIQIIIAALYLILVPVYMVGTLGIQIVHILLISHNQKASIQIMAGSILYLLMTLLLLVMYKPLISYFKRDAKVNFTIEFDSNKRWYLLHPINKSEFLLGNSPVVEECSEMMVVQREELYATSILKERIE